jgi:small subunit ribosomal protein S4
MIIGPKYKIARRLGAPVFEKCQTQKFAQSEARHAKTAKKGKRRGSVSTYGLQLIEKQKIRYTYGITEHQLANYVAKAVALKKGTAKENLYQLLEARLDNAIYRAGVADTRRQARQMTSHGHILVNGKRTMVPSYSVSAGDVFSIREGSKTSPLFANLEKKSQDFITPAWLTFDQKSFSGKVLGIPTGDEPMLDFAVVIEFYSR